MLRKKEIVEKRSVLFVDDIELSLHSIERCLLNEPYHKLFATSSKEVFEVLTLNKVHVIITDMCMPEMTGLELLRTARKDYPDIIGMILTEYMQDAELQAAEENGEIFKLIPKSWNNEENFKNIILEAIDSYNLQSKCDTVKQKN
ncbi:MAG: response regulator [Planctomycetes bacterium]|nr:response regulator [Planctomycetota bacterium]